MSIAFPRAAGLRHHEGDRLLPLDLVVDRHDGGLRDVGMALQHAQWAQRPADGPVEVNSRLKRVRFRAANRISLGSQRKFSRPILNLGAPSAD